MSRKTPAKGRKTKRRSASKSKVNKQPVVETAARRTVLFSKWLLLRLLIVYLAINFGVNLVLNISQPLKPLRLFTFSRIDERLDAAGLLVKHYLPMHRCEKHYDRPQIEKTAHAVAKEVGVDPALLLSIVETESAFRPHVISQVGAIGVAQLMPSTAAWLSVEDPFDVKQNLEGSARFLKRLERQFKGDFSLIAAAYNAGPGAVRRYGGIPPYGETRHYVKKVLAGIKRRRSAAQNPDTAPVAPTAK